MAKKVFIQKLQANCIYNNSGKASIFVRAKVSASAWPTRDDKDEYIVLYLYTTEKHGII